MVTIISSSTILPTEPTPAGPFWLSESDQINPWTHAPTIYTYKTSPNPNVVSTDRICSDIENMRKSLSQILVPYYPLAGRIRWIEGGRLQLECNSAGAVLLEAESAKAMHEYGNFEPDHTIKELIPMVDYSKPLEELPLLLVQVTRFSCGSGISIGFALSHILADGVSAIHFINSWAKLARGETLSQDEMPFLDRTVLKSREPLAPPRFDHKELYQPFPLVLGSFDNKKERKKETTVALLKLTRDQVAKLKDKANEGQVTHKRPYTRYEALGAHVWRCASKARAMDIMDNDFKLQPTLVRFVLDIRNRFEPPLPPNYFGNALLRTVTPICYYGDLLSKPLSYGAQKMREAIELFLSKDDYLRSQLDFITSEKNVEWLRASYHTLNCEKAPFFGNPNLAIGTWLRIPVYEADFGWGKPVYMGPGGLNADGKVFLVPGPEEEDGSVIIAIRLQTPHMETFKKLIYQDI